MAWYGIVNIYKNKRLFFREEPDIFKSIHKSKVIFFSNELITSMFLVGQSHPVNIALHIDSIRKGGCKQVCYLNQMFVN